MLKENNYFEAAMLKATRALGTENVESWATHNGPVEDATGGAWVTLCVFVSDAEAADAGVADVGTLEAWAAIANSEAQR